MGVAYRCKFKVQFICICACAYDFWAASRRSFRTPRYRYYVEVKTLFRFLSRALCHLLLLFSELRLTLLHRFADQLYYCDIIHTCTVYIQCWPLSYICVDMGHLVYTKYSIIFLCTNLFRTLYCHCHVCNNSMVIVYYYRLVACFLDPFLFNPPLLLVVCRLLRLIRPHRIDNICHDHGTLGSIQLGEGVRFIQRILITSA